MKKNLDTNLLEIFFENSDILLELEQIDNNFEVIARFRTYEHKIRSLEYALLQHSNKIEILESKLHSVYTGKRFRLGHALISFARKVLFLK